MNYQTTMITVKNPISIIFVICSAHTTCRGKGDNFRLGHGTEDHVRHPRQLEVLNGRRVISAAVGAMHCLAITEEGEVFGWGKNEQGQLGDLASTSVAEPTLLPAMEGKFIVGASCGPSQVCFSSLWVTFGSVGLAMIVHLVGLMAGNLCYVTKTLIMLCTCICCSGSGTCGDHSSDLLFTCLFWVFKESLQFHSFSND